MKARIHFLLIKNTLYKEYRNKTLLLLFLFTLLILWLDQTFFDFIFNQFFKAQNLNLIQYKLDLFYYIISSWNILISALLGVSCVKSDRDEGVLEGLLSLPISRLSYVLSRIFGTWLIVIGYYVLSLLLAITVFSFDGLQGQFLGWPILSSLLMSSLPILIVITLSVFFSLHFSRVWALITTLFLTGIISHANETFSGRFLEQISHIDGPYKAIIALIHSLIPHSGTFNTLSKELFGNHELTKSLTLELLHFSGSYALLIFAVMITFRQKGP